MREESKLKENLKQEIDYVGRRILEEDLKNLFVKYNLFIHYGLANLGIADIVRILGEDRAKELVGEVAQMLKTHKNNVIKELQDLAGEIDYVK